MPARPLAARPCPVRLALPLGFGVDTKAVSSSLLFFPFRLDFTEEFLIKNYNAGP